MSPQAPLSEDPLAVLRERLRDLYLYAGEPSSRTLAKQTGAMSHSTAHGVIRCISLPRWGNLELVVEALKGDVTEFKALWIAAHNARAQPPDYEALYRRIGYLHARLRRLTS